MAYTSNNPSGPKQKKGVRWGVARRLFLAFCGVTLMTVLVAVVAHNGLHDSRETLGTSLDSFEQVSTLLEETNKSLANASAILKSTGLTLDTAVSTMEETSNRVNMLNSLDLPAVIAIGTIREALTAVAVGERTLLMRQLYDMDIRNAQRIAITNAFERGDLALTAFSSLMPSLTTDKQEAWQQFLHSWVAWKSVHDQLMEQFDEIDGMLRERKRGGFEFEEVAKNAFDIAFGEGQTAREEVNRRLDAVVNLISSSARESARIASDETQIAAGDAITAKNGMTNATQQIEGFTSQMAILNDQVKDTTNAAKTSIEHTDRATLLFLVCCVLGLAVSIVLALWQTRYISRPIRLAAKQMNLLAQGNIAMTFLEGYADRTDEIGVLARSVGEMLEAQREIVCVAGEMASGDFSGSVSVRSDDDKLGRALSDMMQITHDALVQVNAHVKQVTNGAGDITTVSQSLSEGAVASSTALVQIYASTTQIGDQTHRNAQNASSANEFAISSRKVAENGYTAVEEMVASMQEIQSSSKQIAQIVKLIDDIAFQTNLLALNAAVEAARAGRQGKGFSVVAEEVRNLAARSATAAKQTASLVEDTVQRVENGAAIALRTDAAFKEILDNAQRTADLYREIAQASHDQSKSIDQIATSLGQIDRTTQQNTQYASQTASAARSLYVQSDELRNMMERFQLQKTEARGGTACRIPPSRRELMARTQSAAIAAAPPPQALDLKRRKMLEFDS